jgi:hypothetical protein
MIAIRSKKASPRLRLARSSESAPRGVSEAISLNGIGLPLVALSQREDESAFTVALS